MAPYRPLGSKLPALIKTLAIAVVAGALFSLIHVPLPWILGPLTATIIAGRSWPPVYMPAEIRLVLQPILGVSFGSYFTPQLFGQLGQWPAVMLTLAAYVAAASVFGICYLRYVAGFDRLTAFFAAVPGGFGELTLIGTALGANTTLLGLVHSIRLVVVIGTMPFILALFVELGAGVSAPPSAPMEAHDLAILGACAIVGFFGGRLVRLPVAPLFGPLIASAIVHATGWTQSSPPGLVINVTQIALGAIIGSGFDIINRRHVGVAALHSVACAIGLVILAVLFAELGAYLSGFPVHYLLMALSPGGIAEMGLLAMSLGLDVALVTSCHVARLLLVFVIIPFTGKAPPAADPPGS